MTESIIDISIVQLMLAYLSFMILTLIIRMKLAEIANDMVKALVRMTVQLVFAGLILETLFSTSKWHYIVILIGVIYIAATKIVFDRLKLKTAHAYRNILISLVAGTSIVLMYYILVIIGQDPWYNPRYIIPLGTMLIGNSMNSCALAVERFLSSIHKERTSIYTYLSYGATPYEATAPYIHEAFKASFLPAIITMMAIGLVILPGVMSGQILAGADPLVAIKYQVVIMLAIVSSEVLVSYIILIITRKEIFNERSQLIYLNNK